VVEPSSNPLPAGIRTIAMVFALCGLYLAGAGLIILVSPGTISLTVGAPLLFGLELAGPYMFLLMAAAAGGIAWGLLSRVNLARRAAVLAAVAGIVMLVPAVSAAAALVQAMWLAVDGLGIIIRVVLVWYLSQSSTVDQFRRRPGST